MTGIVLSILAAVILVGGIRSISRVSGVVVPLMAVFYIGAGLLVLIGNIGNIPQGVAMIFRMAFSVQFGFGAMAGTVTASMMQAVLLWSGARCIF